MIGLMDCNNFFVSCERLFRPDLLGKPVLVLSSNDGCVVARSQEVKDLGVPMGIPYFEIKDLCKKHRVTIFSSNFALYRDISARVMTALRAEFDTCEVYSVDEAFFEVSTSVTEAEMATVRARIIQKTGIPVSIGLATTKTLAKVANGIAKKRTIEHLALGQSKSGYTLDYSHLPSVSHPMSHVAGVCVLDPQMWKEIALTMQCGSIWGIGRETSTKLSRHKIYTVAELLAQDSGFIRTMLGVVGERLCMELGGISVYKIGDVVDEVQQSYMSTRSFRDPIMDKQVLMSALGYHIAHVAEKLREDNSVAGIITIILRGSRFGSFSHRKGVLSSVLVIPTNDTLVLTKEVTMLLETLFDPEIPYKKAGVVVSAVKPEVYQSESLFAFHEHTKNTKDLSVLADTLNGKFGHGTLRVGVTLGASAWEGKQHYASSSYTTDWTQIPLVKAT